MQRALAYVMTPTHAISLDVALQTIFPDGHSITCDVLVGWPGLPSVQSEIQNIVEKMLSNSPIKYHLFSDQSLLSPSEPYGHIFYAHDIVDNIVQSLCLSWPDALRVCLGDALGMVCERNYHLGLIKDGKKPSVFCLAAAKVRHSLKLAFSRRTVHLDQSIVPDLACLILPVDQTGSALAGVQVTVPHLALVRKVLNQMAMSLVNLRTYIDSLEGEQTDRRTFVLLMENIAEGGYLSLDDEIRLYQWIIEKHAPAGSHIIIKGHPGEILDRYTPLIQNLGARYKVSVVPQKFKRIPFELWSSLILKSEILSMSYPTLSLGYLYDKTVINPVDNDFIQKWYAPMYWESFKNAHNLYVKPLSNLSRWAHKGVLAAGPF